MVAVWNVDGPGCWVRSRKRGRCSAHKQTRIASPHGKAQHGQGRWSTGLRRVSSKRASGSPWRQAVEVRLLSGRRGTEALHRQAETSVAERHTAWVCLAQPAAPTNTLGEFRDVMVSAAYTASFLKWR